LHAIKLALAEIRTRVRSATRVTSFP